MEGDPAASHYGTIVMLVNVLIPVNMLLLGDLVLGERGLDRVMVTLSIEKLMGLHPQPKALVATLPGPARE